MQDTFQTMVLTLRMGRGRKRLVVEGRFTDDRHVWECDGFPHRYALRGSDYDWGRPVTVEESVVVNYCGRFFTKEPLPLKNEFLGIHDYWYTC